MGADALKNSGVFKMVQNIFRTEGKEDLMLCKEVLSDINSF